MPIDARHKLLRTVIEALEGCAIALGEGHPDANALMEATRKLVEVRRILLGQSSNQGELERILESQEDHLGIS